MDGNWTAASGWAPFAAGLLLAALGFGWAWRRRPSPHPAAAAGAVGNPPAAASSRQAFEDLLDEATHRADVEQRPLAVLMLGLDEFHVVNESYGRAVGDQVLADVPARIDAALPQALARARLTADEFAIALWADAVDAQLAAIQLLAELRRARAVDGHALGLDASIGIALYPQHGARPRLLLHAGVAMRTVKGAGGGAHATFEPSMAVDLRQQSDLLRDLRQAVLRQELQLVYQPQVAAGSRRITAVEALLRWQHPQRGCIAPETFLALAEKHGLIAELGRWVVEEATRQAGAWRAAGLDLRVSVNLSAAQLRQDDLVQHLVQCLQRHGVPPQRFGCEVTEAVATEDTRVVNDAFERLRAAGVHVSIDDVGTGRSSLATLRRLPAAELKIDRAFVQDLATSRESRAIASAVIQMAQRLGLRAVAEGVETEAQRDWLLRKGCEEMQGWLFARPMAAHVLAVWASGDSGPMPLSAAPPTPADRSPR